MKKVIVFLAIISSFLYSKIDFVKPLPTFDNPRLWVVKLATDDIHKINHTIDAINNVLKIYPPQTLSITVIAYSSGMRVLKKDYDKQTLLRIKSLMQYDVEFVGCKNTMETMGWKEDEFIDGIVYVQAGIAQVIEKVASGYIDVTPY